MFHMKQLTKWRPLIIEPNLTLMWGVGWLNLITIIQQLRGPIVVTNQLIEALIMLSALVLVVDLLNLILIYQQSPAIVKTPIYRGLSLLFAVIMICLLVLAWSNPGQVLLPNRVTSLNLLFLLLASVKAYLGDFFATTSRLLPFPPRRDNLLWWGTSMLFGQGLLIYPLTVLHTSLRWLPIILIVIGICVSIVVEWRSLPALMNDGDEQRSAVYQLLLGLNLASGIATIFFGLDTIAFRAFNTSVDLISFVFVLAWWLMGCSLVTLTAMHHYDNDYRYGHAPGYERLYLLLGAVIAATMMLTTAWLVTIIR